MKEFEHKVFSNKLLLLGFPRHPMLSARMMVIKQELG